MGTHVFDWLSGVLECMYTSYALFEQECYGTQWEEDVAIRPKQSPVQQLWLQKSSEVPSQPGPNPPSLQARSHLLKSKIYTVLVRHAVQLATYKLLEVGKEFKRTRYTKLLCSYQHCLFVVLITANWWLRRYRAVPHPCKSFAYRILRDRCTICQQSPYLMKFAKFGCSSQLAPIHYSTDNNYSGREPS